MYIVPMAEMTVDITSPQSRWKLPFVVVFAISAALVNFCVYPVGCVVGLIV